MPKKQKILTPIETTKPEPVNVVDTQPETPKPKKVKNEIPENLKPPLLIRQDATVKSEKVKPPRKLSLWNEFIKTKKVIPQKGTEDYNKFMDEYNKLKNKNAKK
jgi:hypothetical protein